MKMLFVILALTTLAIANPAMAQYSAPDPFPVPIGATSAGVRTGVPTPGASSSSIKIGGTINGDNSVRTRIGSSVKNT